MVNIHNDYTSILLDLLLTVMSIICVHTSTAQFSGASTRTPFIHLPTDSKWRRKQRLLSPHRLVPRIVRLRQERHKLAWQEDMCNWRRLASFVRSYSRWILAHAWSFLTQLHTFAKSCRESDTYSISCSEADRNIKTSTIFHDQLFL